MKNSFFRPDTTPAQKRRLTIIWVLVVGGIIAAFAIGEAFNHDLGGLYGFIGIAVVVLLLALGSLPLWPKRDADSN